MGGCSDHLHAVFVCETRCLQQLHIFAKNAVAAVRVQQVRCRYFWKPPPCPRGELRKERRLAG
jgi:hypothetical protein